jgi:hypothetical protein
MEQHLARQPSHLYWNGLYYSQVQLQIAGLLGINLKVTKGNKWKCPFGLCAREFGNYAEIVQQIHNEHQEYEKIIYSKVGGF